MEDIYNKKRKLPYLMANWNYRHMCGEHPHKRTFLDFDNSSSSRLLSTGDPSKGCLTASRPVSTAPPVPTAS